MKTAIVNGKEIKAGADAPATAICPECGAKVLLKRHGPTYAYHHATAVPDCPHTWRSSAQMAPRDQCAPEYFLFISAIRRAILDALDGGGPQALDWLFSEEAQASLALLLGRDEGQTLAATERLAERLKAVIAAGQGYRLRRLVAFNAFEQVERFPGFAEREDKSGQDQAV